MSFADAVRSVFSQYASFNGRARRSEYWFFLLFAVLTYIAAVVLDAVIGAGIFSVIALLGLLVPSLAVMTRRLHDTGRSGWWQLISLIPFGGIVLLVFACTDGGSAPNEYGPSPKAPVGGFAPQAPPMPAGGLS
jgi:uncharacterized membrane protein YhaH (DUF805 family)